MSKYTFQKKNTCCHFFMWTEQKEAASKGYRWCVPKVNLFWIHIWYFTRNIHYVTLGSCLILSLLHLDPNRWSLCRSVPSGMTHAHSCPKTVTFRDIPDFLLVHILFGWPSGYFPHITYFSAIQRFETGIFPLSRKKNKSFTSSLVSVYNSLTAGRKSPI